MKKSLLAIAFAMVAMVSSAQVYVGGGLKANMEKNGNLSNSVFMLAPEVGYALNDNLAFGASFDFTAIGAKVKIGDTKSKSNSSAWSLKPYVRYTFYNAGILSCFVDGVFSVSGAKGGNGTSMGLNLCPGVALSVTENVSVVSRLISLGFRDLGSQSFGFDASFASFGVYYAF